MSKISFARYVSDDFVLSHSRIDSSPRPFKHQTVCEYEFIYYVEAAGTYCIEDKEFPVSDGMLIIIPPAAIYTHIYNEDTALNRYHMRFNPSLFSSDILSCIPSDLFALKLEEISFLASLFNKIDYYCQNIKDEALLRPLLIHTIEEIAYGIYLHLQSGNSGAEYSTNPIFSRVIAFIDKNLHNDITIEKICNELFVSKSYLHQLFTQRLDKTPKKYITEKKLFLARMDIRSGVAPTEAYAKYGFSNYSTFYRSYKSILGCSPSEDYKHCNSGKNK